MANPVSSCRRIIDLVLYKTYAELKAEAVRTYIGLLWWILEPIVFMLIFYFVFGILFERSVENFVPFLLIGLTTWHWLQSTVTQSANAIVSNQALIQQVVVPKALFPTVVVMTNSAKFAIVFLILLAFLVVYGIELSIYWLFSALVLAVLLILIVGLSFLFAAIIPLIPDVRVLIDNGFRALFFLSGIFYDIASLPEPFAAWLRLNPIAVLLENLRGSLMYAREPSLLELVTLALLGSLLCLIGLLLMRANRSRYAKTLA